MKNKINTNKIKAKTKEADELHSLYKIAAKEVVRILDELRKIQKECIHNEDESHLEWQHENIYECKICKKQVSIGRDWT